MGPGGWGSVAGARGCSPTGTHTLQLSRAQPSDSGTYVCEALNAAGRDQKLVQLSVLGASCLSPACTVPTPSVSPQPHTSRAAQPAQGQPAPGEPGVPHVLLQQRCPGGTVVKILVCRVGYTWV